MVWRQHIILPGALSWILKIVSDLPASCNLGAWFSSCWYHTHRIQRAEASHVWNDTFWNWSLVVLEYAAVSAGFTEEVEAPSEPPRFWWLFSCRYYRLEAGRLTWSDLFGIVWLPWTYPTFWRLLLGTQLRLLLFSALAFANVAAVAQSFAQRDYMTALASRDSVLWLAKWVWSLRYKKSIKPATLGWPVKLKTSVKVGFYNKLRRALFLLAVMMPARSLAEFAAGGLSQKLVADTRWEGTGDPRYNKIQEECCIVTQVHWQPSGCVLYSFVR